jgi:hypothetical protein
MRTSKHRTRTYSMLQRGLPLSEMSDFHQISYALCSRSSHGEYVRKDASEEGSCRYDSVTTTLFVPT